MGARAAMLGLAAALLSLAYPARAAIAQERIAVAVPPFSASPAAVLDGWLTLPPTAAARVPAVILSHGSGGRHRAEADYVAALSGMGIAVLALDHFGGRGIGSTVRDQAALSNRAMARDIMAAADALALDGRIEPARIGVLGFSKGGGAAMLAARRSLVQQRAAGAAPLRLHVAYYPWCGEFPQDMRTTGAPLLMLMGGADSYVSVPVCQEWAAAARAQGAAVADTVFPGAPHGFDVPGRPWRDPRGQNHAACVYDERPDGTWRERTSGIAFRPGTTEASAAEARCRREGVAGGPDEAARDEAMRMLLEAVSRHLLDR